MNALLVFVKYPQPGKVKTRLSPPLLPQQAADLYQAMMLDSLEGYRQLEGVTVIPQIEPPSRRDDFAVLFPWPLSMLDQQGKDLGARMLQAFEKVFSAGATKAVVIGTDHPSLPLQRISQAFEALDGPETVVVGPAEDGGYYLLGMTKPQGGLFNDIAWSGPQVMAQTREKAKKNRLNLIELDAWYDVDVGEDLERLRKDLENKSLSSPRVRQVLKGL